MIFMIHVIHPYGFEEYLFTDGFRWKLTAIKRSAEGLDLRAESGNRSADATGTMSSEVIGSYFRRSDLGNL